MKQLSLGFTLLLAFSIGCWASPAGAQEACTVVVIPDQLTFDISGGTLEIRVEPSSPACTFTVRSAYPWLSASPREGAGEALVKVWAGPNSGFQHRVGALTVNNKTVSVLQLGPRYLGANETAGYWHAVVRP